MEHNEEFVQKCVNITKAQKEFIEEERKKGIRFKLSKFVQFKLDEYIKFRKEAEMFREQW